MQKLAGSYFANTAFFNLSVEKLSSFTTGIILVVN